MVWTTTVHTAVRVRLYLEYVSSNSSTFSLVRMTSGAAVPAVDTGVTSMTADGTITPPRIARGDREQEAPQWDAAAAEMIWWSKSGIAGRAGLPGEGKTIMMTASYGRPWRGRRWVSSRGHVAGSTWTARVTARIGGEHLAGPHHFLWTRPLDTLVTMMTSQIHHRTVIMKAFHHPRKAIFARWVTVKRS